ncbi:non-ribosomal peptide synthase/polyketide synthase, partial [Corallococcus terminator]|uniref:non-ribosomal peptide synthase/polyketide synthase n=1 Tax=Corallococcus terminator TaxID=2316733 RepID=UPI001FCA1200
MAPTPEQKRARLAELLREKRRPAQRAPASFAQERMWFQERLAPGQAGLDLVYSVRLSGRLDVESLSGSLNEVVRRHAALRTTFVEQDGRPWQHVAPSLAVPLPVEPVEDADAAWRRLREEARAPFQLEQGPLLRAALFALSDHEHLLMLKLHHAVFDGWSMGVLVHELGAAYRARVAGEAVTLPDLPLQYPDFSSWQRETLRGPALEAQLDWWRTQLDARAVLSLPTDRPRGAQGDPRGASVSAVLPVELLQRLSALAKQEGTTLFTVLLAGFKVLLLRYSGQDTLTVGTPIAGRSRADLEPLIGLFVNTLALRTSLEGDPSFRALIARVQATALGAFAHQDVPFEKLVEVLQPPRHLGVHPFFQVMFAMQDAPLPPVQLPGLSLDARTVDSGFAQFDLTLFAFEEPEGLRLSAEYRTALFDEATVARMLGHLRTLLEDAVSRPQARLSELSLLDAAERQRVLHAWDGPREPFARGLLLHQFVELQVARTPDAVAVTFEGESLTYARLDARANQLAWHLRELGVGPEVRVGLLLERSLELVVALLATLKAGGVYVPFDPSLPAQRLAWMAEDARPAVFLVQERLVARLPAHDGTVFRVDSQWEEVERQPSMTLPPVSSEEALAYVIFTSGSTGRPKGAMNAHPGIVNRLLWMQGAHPLSPDDSVLQKTPFSFDVSLWEFFWPLMTGARLVVARPGGHQEPGYLADLIARERITTTHFVPSMLQVFLEEPGLERCASLRQVLCSGEALPLELAERCLERLPTVRLHNLYGPTETAVEVTAHECVRGALGRSVPIGHPVANTYLRLLDATLRPVPQGVPGELFIGGVQVGRGYLGRPELTAERFVPDAYGDTPGARLYRTGDVARWLPDGAVEYLGRTDFQVKVRGLRIELGEIEAALEQHPAVRQAVVVARVGTTASDTRLVAYLVGRADAAPVETGSLRTFLVERLPEYMVPATFVPLDALPLTASGKVDRKALPAPDAATVVAPAYVAPRSPTEERLASIWAELLRVERVGVHDDFFALGGHSLLATQLLSRIRAAFQFELPLRAVFKSSTLGALASAVDAGQGRSTADQDPPLRAIPRDEAVPLSFAQQRLWFLDQLQPGSVAYNLPGSVLLEGELQAGALRQALDALVQRHEVLRTTFAAGPHGPVQRIASDTACPFEAVDLSTLAPEAREARLREVFSEQARRPFDLARGPLFRAVLVRLEERRHVLLVLTHHIASDGWSTGILVRELVALYSALASGQTPALPPLPLQYADFAAWQRQRMQGELLATQLAWWKEQLAGAPPLLRLPTDRTRPAVQTFTGEQLSVRLPRKLAGGVHAVAKLEGATPFMVLLAAYQLLLSRYAGQDDVSVGAPVAGRTRAEAEGLIGFFVNTLVLRARIDPRASFRTLLAQVRATTLGAFEHQDVPFEKLVEELQPARDPRHTPFFQVTLTLQNAPTAEWRAPGLTLREVPSPFTASKYDFSLILEPSQDGFTGSLHYNPDLFDAAFLRGLLRDYATLLEALPGQLESPVQDLSLLAEADRRRVLEDWSGFSVVRDFSGQTLPSRFARQVALAPEAVALVSEEEVITYAQLDARANQLAHHLRASGIAEGSRVAVLLPRSPELIVSLLAVLKAGAAYVPVDLNAPPERWSLLLEQSGAAMVITLESLADELPALLTPLVLLDAESSRLASRPASALADQGLVGDSLAYVLFTSGSTGMPKGVCVPHRAVLRLVVDNDFVRFGPGEVVLQLAPAAFDASTLEIWGALLNGARLVLAPPGELSLARIADTLVHHRVTTLWLTAALFEQMAVHHPDSLAGLPQVLAGGDVLPAARVREHLGRIGPGAVLINGYGPTENTTFSTTHAMHTGDPVGASVPIGRPLPHSTAYVLDATMRPVPPGMPGELYVGGEGLAWGYLRQPSLTAERFLPHPFSSTPGARLYRTGDQARWRPDGTLEFLGRTDFQVKLRGFRIEPGEVEAALRALPGVHEAVAVVREDIAGDKRLVAYVVGEALEAATLRSALQQRLPDYLIPGAFVVLEALPLNANGKLNRSALPAPEALVSADRFVAPRDALEERLAGLFGEVLHVTRVGIHDDFFELGGHSLLATQVVSRLRSALGVELPLGDLFAAPTVEMLAVRVAALRAREDSAPRVPALVATPRTGPVPLSFAQQRLWFLDQLQPGSAVYNVPGLLVLDGTLDVRALEQSLQALIQRHEALRTTFASEGDSPVQRIHSEGTLALTVIDLESVPEDRREAEVKRHSKLEATRPFDLGTGPLVRAVLLRLEARRHVLLLTLHHIVSDGWSIGIFARELGSLYRAFAAGQPATLPALPLQYADFALWQRQWLQGDVLQAELDWWRHQLGDAPTSLDLPTDRPRPAVQSFRGAALPVTLSPELSASVKALASREGATPFMVLLAGFQLLLSRYAGQDDVLVGSAIANRNRAETEGLIGFFVNTLVLRARIDPRASFQALLAQVKATTLAAYAHQDLPFEKLVEGMQGARDLSRSPLFQVAFNLQNAPAGTLELPGLRLELRSGAITTAKFDLDFSLQERDGAFSGELHFSTDLFEPSTVDRMVTHFQVLLGALTSRPEVPVSSHPLLQGTERQRVLVDWNATHRPLAPHSVPALFAPQVVRAPDAVAVQADGQSLTCAALEARANQLARHLLASGLRPEARVALCVERGLGLVVGMLGILKAGGCYVPMDPAYPRARLAFMFEDAGISAVVAQQSLVGALPAHALPTVCLDSDAAVLERQSVLPPEDVAVDPEQLAYVLYTSGSTGTPKGVGITHQSIAHLVRETSSVRLTPDDCMVQAGTPSFDLATFEVWGALLNGARLVILPREVTLSPAELARTLREVGATTALFATALFHTVAREVPDAFATMRVVLFAGEAANADAARDVLRAGAPGRLVNLYGPTETTVGVTTHDLVDLPEHATSLPIGRPMTRVQTYVLDAQGQPVPVGVPGELYLGGDGLARGYLGRPGLTAERFVPSPFSDVPGARLYRTGDRVRWLPDGTLDFLGRIDTQVKLRGFRIELSEVEAVLRQHPSVKAAVAGVLDAGDPRLVAWYVAAAPVEAAVLRAFVSERLPAPLVPSAFVSLDALPLTPVGKVDRKALPSPDARSVATGASAPEHLSFFQKRIAALFQDLLRLETVGLHDDFFVIGGHSLLATQLISRLRSTFGVELPLRALFEAPTVARLTDRVEAQLLSRITGPRLPALVPVSRDRDLPLSFAQQRLWVVEQLRPGGSHYNVTSALRLEGALDTEALRRALGLVVARHEALRSTFAMKDGQPVQTVHPASAWELPVTDLSAVDVGRREEEARRISVEEAARPFDLGQGPLLRTRLLRLDEGTHLLLLCMHHIVSDGWSLGVLVREVVAGYEAFASGRTPVLPVLPVQYADFAVWQRSWLQGDVLAEQVAWWKQHLSGVPHVLELPTDKARPALQSTRGALLPVHLPSEAVERLVALGRKEGATPYMALLAVWQVLLSRYSRQEELLVGSPIAGREYGELEGLIGFFVNTLVLRGRVRPGDTFRTLLAQVRATTLAAFEHHGLPFEKLVEELQVERDLSRTPLVQAVFALQNAPTGELKAPGLTLRPVAVDNATARFDLGLLLHEAPDGLHGVLEYNTDLFERSTLERFAGHLHTLLDAVVAAPDVTLSRMEWLTPEERRQVVTTWNATVVDYPRESNLAEHFARQVARRPESIALEFGDTRLTYAQLDARANALGHVLRSLGVGPDALVAVCLERTVELIVTLLAILKAGGAYVPLDAAYPARRLSLMVEDAPPLLLVTTRSLRSTLSIPDAVPCLFVEEQSLEGQPTTAPEVAISARNLAYVDFTSGSTGRPKGVAVEHRGVLRLLHGASWASFTPDETFLLIAPLSFDASTLEIWGPLLSGGRLVVFPPVPPTDVELLGQVLRRHGVTSLYLSAGLFAQVVDVKLEVLRGLRQLFVGGDVLSPTHTRRVVETLGLPVVNGYGPTEATVFTCCLRMDSPQAARGDLIPIGPPLANTRVYVVDGSLRPVPVGVPGELLIGGDGLARGYLSRPELTAERFLPDPFASSPGERVYRTGDLVRWRADGSLDFLGRIDTQVKVRGHRIELSEVEAALKGWRPALADAAVLVREDVPGDKRLVAYVVPTVPGVLEVQALREHLRQRLPEYMVPTAFVTLPALPLTPNGKLDRNALPEPDAASTARKGRFVEPGNPLEDQLSSVWARELEARRVGVHDHFFEDLGGTSLTVVRVAHRLRETLQRDVPVVWLFEHPTVHALAQRLEREDAKAITPPVEKPTPRPMSAGAQDMGASPPTLGTLPASQPLATPTTATGASAPSPEKAPTPALPSGAIAIVGMSGRFPGAASVEEFWKNLREGVESISRFQPEELEHQPGLPPGIELWQHPGFVPAQGVLTDIDQFDPSFFDMSLREAQWTDPQQRLFLQCAWAALEDAGIDPSRFPGVISLFAGANESGYASEVQQHMPLDSAAYFELFGTATYQSLATKVSYKLGLTGESMLLYTACSTGLVAVHVACQNLLTGLSDVALAGATRLSVPQRTGYVHQEGMIYSPDGHCRAFDAKGQGTVSGSGVAAVVLKRLEDAVRDGDPIHAVIRATAVNNDGRNKSGFTAPSVQGQAAVITQALKRSGVTPRDIGYVETHGTATPLGDPIEVAALTRAYGLGPDHQGTIALASLKTNVGHLDTVAGIAGLIKVALSLREGEIPPSLHFENPNPRIDFDAGPFFVNTRLRPWPRGETPRRAAVSSFGVGGTNAHAVLEEAPVAAVGPTSRSHQLFVLSARSPEALGEAALKLASHVLANRAPEALEAASLKLAQQVLSARSPESLEMVAKQLALHVLSARSPEALEALSSRFSVRTPGAEMALADAAYTQAVGRRAFEYRRTVVARDAEDLAKQLRKSVTPVRVKDVEAARRKRVAFVFSGQGSQQWGMGRELSESLPSFRAHVDTCLALLDEPLRARVTALLRPGREAEDSSALADTRVALPALFTVQVALARLWQDWGIVPHAVLGHSFGEYAAACVAGVLSLPEALRLAVVRGELMHRLPPGAMLGVALPATDVQPLLSGRLTLAASNAPDRCVVSGPVEEVERFQSLLQQRKAGAVRMPSPHAFHSADVEPLMGELARVVATLQRQEPSVRYVSSLTGAIARPGELASPDYWATKMRQPVRFTDAVGSLLEEGCSVLLEVGPGQDLTPLMRACLGEDRERVKALASLRRGGTTTEQSGLLQCVGELWTAGLEVDWDAFYAHEQRRRVHLPTYAFLRKRCWVEPRVQDGAPSVAEHPGRPPEVAQPPGTHLTAPAASPQAPASPASGNVSTTAQGALPAGREDAPRGEVELRIATLWRERLGMDFVGRDDNFLELGGNSLMAAQLLNQLRDTFHVQVPLAALFEAPTVAGLASRIEPLLLHAPVVEPTRELPLVPRPRTQPLPLAFVQERVWRLEQYLPGLSAYTIPFVLRLEGPADVATLERAIQEVVQRHEALRTTYDAVDGRPVQRFHPHVRIPLPVVTVEGTPEQREEAALQFAREDAARPFDLVHGPVLRTTLVRLRADLHLLVCAIHHIVCDTLSIFLFLQEVGQLYAAFVQGQPSPLPPLPVQYADFGAWQRQSLAESRFPEQEQWWRQRLAGMPRQLGIPTDRPRPANCPLTSERRVLDFPPELSDALVAFGRREGFTSYMTVLAAWNALLHRYTGQADLIVGTPIGNRTRPELLPLIGYVAHSATFRTHVGDDPSFRELLHRVRREVTDVQSRPDVPFELLVEQLVPGKDIGRDRMADTVFVYHSNLDMGGDALAAVGAKGTLIEVPGTPVQWGATLSDLTLILTEEPGRVHGALEYATELFDASTAWRMLEHLQVLLGAALARPETPLSRLPLATEQERRAWPQPLATAQAPTLPELLREQARRLPDTVALSQGERTWTWTELANRAHRLATRLRELGLSPGEPVAVCLRASPEKLAALWGVLEAGGAPVALGPTDLDSLSAYALEDGTVPRLVTWRGLVTSCPLDASRVLHVEEVLDVASLVTMDGGPPPTPDSLAWLLPMGMGQPAWALKHASLADFFAGLDARLRPEPGTTWLAASEPAPEKPELEALWALSRGLRIVFPSETVTSRLAQGSEGAAPLQFSLSYFANDEDSLTGPKYELLMEGAKFADANGFSAVWTPERHFHSFGGLYPQPAVVSAALAAVTHTLRLRSGSVVLPLHDPLLVAEQWSVVDNLSQGRVDVSVATGWHVQDFTFAPQNYADRRNILLRHLETLRSLWRGERQRRPGGNGVTVEVGLRPKPVQKELPVWLTATANPETFRLAGELGAGVLTGLFAHSLEELKPKVALYREAWRRNGHPGRGHITCMLHTFLGDDEAEVLRQVRKPLLAYFRSSADITASLLAAQGHQGELNKISKEDIDALLEHTFEHHAKGTGLIGTVDSGLERLRAVRASDVDEVTCLIDFGLETPVVLQGLRRLATLRELLVADEVTRQSRLRGDRETGVGELLTLARQSGAVLVNTTARLARSLAELPGAHEALAPVSAWMLEGASKELASALHRASGGTVLLAGEAGEGGLLPRAAGEKLPADLQVWVLDSAGVPVPAGVVGELALAGPGLPASLWKAPEGASRQWVPHPLRTSARLYRTGRPVRLRADGHVEPVSLPTFKLPALRPASNSGSADTRPASGANATAESGAHQAIPGAPRGGPLPLSFAQQRLWYLQQLEPDSTAYNNAIIFRLTGPLDARALQTALDALVERHEVLRTTYALTSTHPVQHIHPTGMLPMDREDVPGDTAEAREAAMLRRCQAYTATPFHLDTGPVARALLLRLGPDAHVLHLLLHHVVSDAWCTLVLGRELPVLYTCASAGVPSVLPPLPVQYADYAVWQRAWLTGPVLEEQARWWKDLLQGAPPLELPTDLPRPAMQSYAGAAHRFHLPREVSEPLLAVGRREGATSFMVLMALFQALLSRYSGQEDFAVGTPIAGRTRPEVEGLLGCFVNTLALRAKLDGAPNFRELIARVKHQALGAYARQDMPFERLVDVLQAPRDLSRTPVFQAILNVINVPEAQTTDGQGLRIGDVDVPVTTSKFDLTLEVREQRDGLLCRLEYATALFDEATLARMAEHLTALAKAVTAAPDAPVADLPLLSTQAREQVLRGWNDTQVEFPRGSSLHQLFEAQAERTPDAIALQFEGQQLTYGQLDARANQLAHHLRIRGVGPETLVGVCLERSLEMVVALLGVLKSGAAYVPLDPSTPTERLIGMLEDTAAPVLLIQERFRNALPAHAAHVIALDTEWDAIARQPISRPRALAGEDALAYVIFTSGSTGRPKGAMNAHAGIVNRLRWMQSRYGLTTEDTVLQKTPFSFDVSVWEFFWPLMTGAKLVLARPGGHQEPDYLTTLMAREGVTTAHFVPSMLRAFVEEPGLEHLTRLRQVMCSGEALPADLVHKAQARLPHATLHNLYGPTEAAVDVTSWECPRDDALRVVPIGRPVANTRLYVLDRRNQPVPVGIPGELFIGGVQVGRGYWRRPTLTAERFVPDAHGGTPGARLYRTGDIARWRTDGTLEYLGRADFQVKLRGFRIELGDIEAALQAWPGVREAVAVVRQDSAGAPRLVAYVTAEGAAPDTAALRAFLHARLPEYMVPSALVTLEALPLTSSGKVDRKALPTPDAPTSVKGESIAPRDDTERTLAAIFAEVLGVERVGVQDSFFELGGHSLLATQVAARVRAQFGKELPLRTLFEAPTVEALSRRLVSALEQKASSAPASGRAAFASEPEDSTVRASSEHRSGRAPSPSEPGPASVPSTVASPAARQPVWFVGQQEPGWHHRLVRYADTTPHDAPRDVPPASTTGIPKPSSEGTAAPVQAPREATNTAGPPE